MQMALKHAGIAASDIDYVNAHGTSTMADGIELGAVERLLGNAASKTVMSSTKSSIGHLLGAAGSVEAIFCLFFLAHARRDRAAHHQSGQSGRHHPDRSGAAHGAEARGQYRHVEQLRFRWHQRLPDHFQSLDEALCRSPAGAGSDWRRDFRLGAARLDASWTVALRETVILIPPRTRAHDVAVLLQDKGVVQHWLLFEFGLRTRKLADKIKAGEYALPPRAPWRPSPAFWWKANPSSTG